jgi:hypothetical protein
VTVIEVALIVTLMIAGAGAAETLAGQSGQSQMYSEMVSPDRRR